MGEQPVVPLAPRQPVFFFFFWLEEEGLLLGVGRGSGGRGGWGSLSLGGEEEEGEGGKSMSWYHSLTCASALRAAHRPLPNKKKKNRREE